MKGFRRSVNKDKEQQRPSFGQPSGSTNGGIGRAPANATISPAMASAGKLPPKGIIRSIAAYKSKGPQELSFGKGDFFHIMGERPATDGSTEDWYDAANPATGARGLVPMSCFEVIGKTTSGKKSPPPTGQMASMRLGGNTNSSPSKFAISAPQNAMANGKPMSMISKGGPAALAAQQSKSPSLYGIVQYDFDAQRADELDAKKGEHIILIAQSNHEWFVAKPIGRLGGPGLIPVSFVEIMNMATGKALDSSVVAEMVRGGALPPVEEWKRSTAEYKQTSIPLGRFDFAPAKENAQAGPSHTRQQSTSRQATSQYGASNNREPTYSMDEASRSAPALSPNPNASNFSVNRLQEDEYNTNRQSAQSQRTGSGEQDGEEDYVAKYGILSHASVESFHQEEGSFWFHMRCAFSSDYNLVLYRLYDDFYSFQMSLMDAFKVEAGRQLPDNARPGDKPRRILPMMPGPATEVDELVCTQRVADLTVYLADLCRLPDYIKTHDIFYDFLLVRPGDVEINVPRRIANDPRGPEEAENDVVQYLDRMPGAKSPPVVHPSYLSDGQREQDNYDRRSHTSDRSYKPSGLTTSGSNRPPSGPTPPTSATTAHPPGRVGQPNAAFVKIKIFHRNTDDLIAIRVPPHVTYQALIDKVRERLGSDVTKLRFREELGNSQARLVEIYNDDDLGQWLHGTVKLVLYAD